MQLLALICTTWCMHQLHQTAAFRHDTCAEILTCLTRVAFAIGVTRLSSSLSSLPLAPLTSKPHALPLILNPHSNARRYFSLCKKKRKVPQIKLPSRVVLTRKRLSFPARSSSARMADADCFSRHFLRQPSWQQTRWPWELIPECQLALFI